MAQRRMFSKKITHTDAFLEMPPSTKVLYFYLALEADDEGFVDSPKRVIKMTSSNDDDYKILVAKRFILPFENGICVVKHWLIHNYIQSDRFAPTQWVQERRLLKVDPETKKYQLNKGILVGVENVSTLDTQVRLELGKDSIDTPVLKRLFIRPTLDEVIAYCKERKNSVDPERWYDHYESNGWRVGKNLMKDWKAAIRTWERSEFSTQKVGAKTHRLS